MVTGTFRLLQAFHIVVGRGNALGRVALRSLLNAPTLEIKAGPR
jgi:hypothetical protein